MSSKLQQPYFPHDANSRNKTKLTRLRMSHGPAGYGVYFMLLERLRCSDSFESDLDYDVLSFDLDCDAELIRSVINDFGLFEITNEGLSFHSIELTEQMAYMQEQKERRAEAARRAAEARWGKRPDPIRSERTLFDEPEVETPSHSNSTCRLESEIATLKADTDWLGFLKDEFKLSDSDLDRYFLEFEKVCKGNGQKDGHTDLTDAHKHFRSMIAKIRNGGHSYNGVRASGKSSPVTERLNEIETQALKELDARRDEELKKRKSHNFQNFMNYYRNHGYVPEDITWEQFNDENWRQQNPPKHPEWIGMFPGNETVAQVESKLKAMQVEA